MEKRLCVKVNAQIQVVRIPGNWGQKKVRGMSRLFDLDINETCEVLPQNKDNINSIILVENKIWARISNDTRPILWLPWILY